MAIPLITVADLRECLQGDMAILAMPGHEITHFYHAPQVPAATAHSFFAAHPDLDYVDSVVLEEVG